MVAVPPARALYELSSFRNHYRVHPYRELNMARAGTLRPYDAVVTLSARPQTVGSVMGVQAAATLPVAEVVERLGVNELVGLAGGRRAGG